MKIIIIILLYILLVPIPVNAREQLILTGSDDLVTVISEKVLSEAYQRLGIKVHTKFLPSKRSLLMTNNGKFDGQLGRIRGIDIAYPNLLMVPVPINIVDGAVFTKNLSIDMNGWESLKPYTIGILRGGIFIEEGTKDMDVVIVDGTDSLFHMLDRGRIDVSVIGRITGLLAVKQLKLEQINALVVPAETVKLYHYLNKKHASLIPEITRKLKEMEAQGRIDEIREQAITELLD